MAKRSVGAVRKTDRMSSQLIEINRIPKPGDATLALPERFFEVMLFPPHPDAMHGVKTGDATWIFPVEWSSDKRLNRRTVKIDCALPDGSRLSSPENRDLLVAKTRLLFAMYRAPKRGVPPDVATLISYSSAIDRLFRLYVSTQNEERRNLSTMTYSEQAALLSEWFESYRNSIVLGTVLNRIRYHHSLGHLHGSWFDPLPSLEGITSFRDEERQFQPLPDNFTAVLGQLCWFYEENVWPHVEHLLGQRAIIRDDLSRQKLTTGSSYNAERRLFNKALRQHEWGINATCFPIPPMFAFPPRDGNAFMKVLLASQCARHILLSLVIGARVGEVQSLTRDCLRILPARDGTWDQSIRGVGFKTSDSRGGEARDWPVPTDFGEVIQHQIRFAELIAPSIKALWVSVKNERELHMGNYSSFVRHHGLQSLLGESSFHHHRFRKTLARLVVLAIMGGPKILQELFHHRSLVMTLRYVFSSPTIEEDMLAIAEAERDGIIRDVFNKADNSGGPGADYIRKTKRQALDRIQVFLPKTKRGQASFTDKAVIESLQDTLGVSPDGGGIRMIMPGIFCVKPVGEAGICSRANEVPNVAQCEARCLWHLQQPIRRSQVRANIEYHIERLAVPEVTENELLADIHHRGLLTELSIFNDVTEDFKDHPTVLAVQRAFRTHKPNV